MFASLSVNERDFILEALDSNFRIDARGPQDVRPIQVKFGTATNKNGQVLLSFGRTKVLTQTHLKLTSPQPGRPQEGFLKFNADFDSLNHMAEFTNQTSTVQEMKIEIQSFIDKVIRNSRATDKEGLCIISGKLVWSVTVQMHLLNDDGNLYDAFFLAAVLALKNTRIPEVSLANNKIKINDEKQKFLNVHHLPVASTFYFLQGRDQKPVVDVNSKEERLCDARLTIVMNSYEDICGITSLGALNLGSAQHAEQENSEDDEMSEALASGVDHATLFECMDQALVRAKQVTSLIRSTWDSRNEQFSILDIKNEDAKAEAKDEEHQKRFIQRLNEELEANRVSHPSKEDAASDASMEDDGEPDKKPADRIIEGALQNKDKPKEHKSRDGRSNKGGRLSSNRDRSRDSTQGSEQLMENDRRFQKLREKKRVLREVEGQDAGEMSLTSGIRKKRRTNRE